MPNDKLIFKHARICSGGHLLEEQSFAIATGSGRIISLSEGEGEGEGDAASAIDLKGAILAPGYLELQTNGMRGFHFTHFEDRPTYAHAIDSVAQYLPSQGVTGFYATLPTVASEEFKKVHIAVPSMAPIRF